MSAPQRNALNLTTSAMASHSAALAADLGGQLGEMFGVFPLGHFVSSPGQAKEVLRPGRRSEHTYWHEDMRPLLAQRMHTPSSTGGTECEEAISYFPLLLALRWPPESHRPSPDGLTPMAVRRVAGCLASSAALGGPLQRAGSSSRINMGRCG